MSAGAPTNNCITDYASANATLTEILTTLPFSSGLSDGSSCSSTAASTVAGAAGVSNYYNAIVDKLQQSISSLDLSFNIPDHPEVGFFGYNTTIIDSNAVSGKYTVELPDVQAMIGFQLGFSIAISIGVIFATILYKYVLSNNNNNKSKNHNQDETKKNGNSSLNNLLKGTIGAVLFTSCTLLPYMIIDLLEARNTNTAVRFMICTPFVLYMFRILEAIFDFVPTGATSSWFTYCAYFSLPFDMTFEEKTNTNTITNNINDNKNTTESITIITPIMATKSDLWNGQWNVVKAIAGMAVMCSILSPYDYAPFGESNAGEFHERIVLSDYLDVRHLGNCFIIAVFFQQALALGDAVIQNIVQMTLSYKVNQLMRNPMLEATSPSDFWGRRWNVLVHSVMKRGVYKPVRKYTSSGILASLAVFVASGLFHEWLVHAVLLYNHPPSSTAGVLLGSNTAFFVWNFFVIVSEKLLLAFGSKGIQSFGKMIPSAVVPFMIIMTSLPMAHWFGNPYLKGGFFGDYEKCLIMIRKV